MSRPLRAVTAAVLVAALPLTALSATEHAPCTDPVTGDPVFDESSVWLHQAETKVGNLGALGATSFPTWDDEAPTSSVQQGAGGGYHANSANYLLQEEDAKTVVGFTAEGPSFGCLDTVLIDLYAFLPTNRTGTSGSLSESAFIGLVTLEADGKTLTKAKEVTFATVPNEGGSATYRLRLAVTNIQARLLRAGLDPEGERALRLHVAPRYINTNNAVFVYDTTEVPAGMTFNGTPDDTYTTVGA